MKAQLGLLFLLWYQSQTGSLQLEAPPGAAVFWDEAALGQIGPSGIMRLEEIPPGQYQLRINLDAQLLFSQTVVVRPGPQRFPAVLDSRESPGRDNEVAPVQPYTDSLSIPSRPPPRQVVDPGRDEQPRPSLQAAAPVSPVERRASSLVDRESNPGWLVLLGVAFGIVLVLWFWRRTLVAEHMAVAAAGPLSPKPEVPPAGRQLPILPPAAPQTPDRQPLSTFLDDLRRREEETDGLSDPPTNSQDLIGSLEVEVIPRDEETTSD